MRDERVEGFRCEPDPTGEYAEADADHMHPMTRADSFRVLLDRENCEKKTTTFINSHTDCMMSR